LNLPEIRQGGQDREAYDRGRTLISGKEGRNQLGRRIEYWGERMEDERDLRGNTILVKDGERKL